MNAVYHSVEQMRLLSTAMSSMDEFSAGVAIHALIGSVQRTAQPDIELMPGSEYGHWPADIGATSCVPTNCMFDFGYDDGFQKKIDVTGTVVRDGDALVFEVKSSISTRHSLDIDWMLTGSVIESEPVKGRLELAGSARSWVTWDTAVEYRGLVLDSSRCPSSGSVHATTVYAEGADEPVRVEAEGTPSTCESSALQGAHDAADRDHDEHDERDDRQAPQHDVIRA